MMITQTMLLAVLRNIRERSPWISGYRRWPDGKNSPLHRLEPRGTYAEIKKYLKKGGEKLATRRK